MDSPSLGSYSLHSSLGNPDLQPFYTEGTHIEKNKVSRATEVQTSLAVQNYPLNQVYIMEECWKKR